jgi:hypothetical protein
MVEIGIAMMDALAPQEGIDAHATEGHNGAESSLQEQS